MRDTVDVGAGIAEPPRRPTNRYRWGKQPATVIWIGRPPGRWKPNAWGRDARHFPALRTRIIRDARAIDGDWEAARRIDPGVVVPMHWGTLIGSRDDAREFVRLVGSRALMLEPSWGLRLP